MKLTDYIPNQTLLAEHLKNGVVETRQHKTLPLTIWCYTRKATFDNIWDSVTTRTRGVITDFDGEVIARPFPKFFNLNHAGRPETSIEELSKEHFAPFIQDKLDGSMGTLWQYQGKYGIATKGSFHSEQAEWATAWLHSHYGTGFPDANYYQYWPVDYTSVFEIINQSIQHHVVHYEPAEDNRLVLIGMVNKHSGEELSPGALKFWGNFNGIDVVDTLSLIPDKGMWERVIASRPNKEGFVVSYARSGAPSLKVKVKHEEFLRLQKIAHHTTPQVVFEYLRDGNQAEIDTVIRDASPFLSDQVKEWVSNYDCVYNENSCTAREIVRQALLKCTTRKEFAEFFLRPEHSRYSAICFKMIDQFDYKRAVWKLVEEAVPCQKFSQVEEE